MALVDQQADQRRAHGRAAPVDFGAQIVIGLEYAGFQHGKQVRRRARGADRLQRRDHGRAGERAVLMPAHAVGDGPEADLRPQDEIVLVGRADLAGMADAAGLEIRVPARGVVHGIALMVRRARARDGRRNGR